MVDTSLKHPVKSAAAARKSIVRLTFIFCLSVTQRIEHLPDGDSRDGMAVPAHDLRERLQCELPFGEQRVGSGERSVETSSA